MSPDEFYSIVARQKLIDVALGVKTPGYVWFRPIVERQVRRLRDALGPRFKLHFAVKANPHPSMLRLIRELGLGADVASAGELERVLECGFEPEAVEFSGPGKRESELATAVEAGVGAINVESLTELELLERLARERGRRANVGLRVNPSSKARTGLRMAGATQFGISEEDVGSALERLADATYLEFVGLHVHMGSQILDADTIVQIYRTCLEIAALMTERTGRPLRKLNFGGGWGVTYFEGQKPLDLSSARQGISALLEEERFARAIADTRFVAEPGRFLVAESGIYVAEVLYTKRSGQAEFAIVDGGLSSNYLLAGGMGQVIRRNFHFDLVRCDERRTSPGGPVTVAGCLCTPQDVLLQDAQFGVRPLPGDRIVFFNCGAYGASASPLGFLGHPAPSESLVA